MIFNTVGGGRGGGVVLNVTRAASLPETVVNGQVVVISDVPALRFSFGYGLPSSPAAGDVWIHVVDSGAYPIELDDGLSHVTITLGATMQYVSGAWAYRNAYVGVGGVWQMCSTLSPLSTLSWAAIGAIAGSGEAMSQFFAVGDKKLVELTTTVLGTSSFEVEVLDFLHDDLADGSGKAPITFGMVDCFATTQVINSDGSANNASGGWPAMPIRATLQGSIFDAFPSDLRAIIKSVTKLSSNDSRGASGIVSATDTLFLLAEIELNGATTYSYTGEGSKYARFVSAEDRIKHIGASAVNWWTRSPGLGTTSLDNWCLTDGAGYATAAFLNIAHAIACAFCV